MDYFEKISENPFKDLYWNIPEGQKLGTVRVIGGNLQNFQIVVRTSEYLINNFPLKEVNAVLPDSLKTKLPSLPNLMFLKSTEAGSFSDAEEIQATSNTADSVLMIGDFSKNAITAKAVSDALAFFDKPVLITRDTVDLIAESGIEKLLMRENLTIFGSLMQWQKIFRAVYYPKILTLSQSLMQVAEAFHKFTLSYPVQMITLHEGQILISKNGKVKVVPLAKTGFSPLTLWNGEMAGRIVALNLYNPDMFIEATVAALFR